MFHCYLRHTHATQTSNTLQTLSSLWNLASPMFLLFTQLLSIGPMWNSSWPTSSFENYTWSLFINLKFQKCVFVLIRTKSRERWLSFKYVIEWCSIKFVIYNGITLHRHQFPSFSSFEAIKIIGPYFPMHSTGGKVDKTDNCTQYSVLCAVKRSDQKPPEILKCAF